MQPNRPEVLLPSGIYAGTRNRNGTMTFHGIPYGTYRGRWKPLGPVTPGGEPHDASGFGPACPQIDFGPYPSMRNTVDFDEAACFTVSVSTADCSGSKPVYVYIHGGANVAGGYFDPKIQTAGFVDRHPELVCVTFNYRLGVLGTLYLEGLTADPEYWFSGNLSTLDQLQALRWVHENIHLFGGDPDNVTIGGQSSGCASVKQLFFVKESWPLWKRAICQSGTTLSRSRPISQTAAREAASRLLQALGVHSLEDLLTLDAETLLSVSPFTLGIAPVEDGITLPEGMNERLCGGDVQSLPAGKEILLGCMNGDMDGFSQDPDSLEKTRRNAADEIADMLRAMSVPLAELYVSSLIPGVTDIQTAAAKLRHTTAEDADRLIGLYEKALPDQDPWHLISDCLNDFLMYNPLALESAGLCRRNTVYLYLWDWSPASAYPLRATHAMEVPFVFGAKHTIPCPLTEAEQQEAALMYDVAGSIWGRFLQGRPPAAQARPFDPEHQPTLLIDLHPRTVNLPRAVSGSCLLQWLET